MEQSAFYEDHAEPAKPLFPEEQELEIACFVDYYYDPNYDSCWTISCQ